MNKHRGFTLIEVLLSLSILGIISVFLLGAISSHFVMLNKTKAITSEAFLTQGKMEKEIDDVKENIRNNSLTLKERTIFERDLGGIDVKYYQAKKEIASKNYYTLVSNIKPELFEPLEMSKIGITLKQASNKVDYGYGKLPFKVIGNFKNLEIDENSQYDFLLNQVEWYVSSEEFNMPLPKDPAFNLEDDFLSNSYYFPIFPRDYELKANETIYDFGASVTELKNLKDYAGRHIVFTATPAAKSGKLGKPSVTSPIFISGLPITDKLIMHLDAAYIDILDDNEVEENAGEWSLKKWIDISSIIGKTSPDESAGYLSYKPKVKRAEIDSGFKDQYVSFSENELVKIMQNTKDNDISVVCVAKNRSKDQDTGYFKNEDFQQYLGLNTSEIENQWIIEFFDYKSKGNSFLFGGKNVDIAEILLYKGKLNEDSKVKIEDYLSAKYKYTIVSGNIVELENLPDMEIKVGESFELPNRLKARMEKGPDKYVSVSWTEKPNTDLEGTYTIIGTAITDPEKQSIFDLTIVNE